MVPMNFNLIQLAHWCRCCLQGSRSTYYTLGQAHVALGALITHLGRLIWPREHLLHTWAGSCGPGSTYYTLGQAHVAPGALITHLGRLMWPRWANDYDAAHPQDKWLQWTWLEWICLLVSFSIHKVLGALTIMPMGKRHSIHQVIKWLKMTHLKTSRSLEGPLVNKVSRAFIMLMGMSILTWWANDHDIVHLQAKAIPMNLRFGSNQPSGSKIPVSTRFQEALLHPLACPCGPNGQMTWHCSSTGQGGFS